MPRILISYIGHNSGHHSAARALDAALKMVDPAVHTMLVDLFAYITPRVSAAVDKLYMVTIRRAPEVWESLYDSPWLDKTTRRLRKLIQSGDSDALKQLMDTFKPDAAICTQAHPLAVLSSYAQENKIRLPLWGVVTDYVPHRFWVVDGTPEYVVPTEEAARRLVLLGVPPSRINVFGIPVHPRVAEAARQVSEVAASGSNLWGYDTAPRAPHRLLIIGGSRGLGVRYRTIKSIDASPLSFSMEIVTGMNRRLRGRLLRNRTAFSHRIRVRGFVRDIVPLLQKAILLVSKPGGLTSAEATALGVPMVIVRPLPGQEQNNANVLVRQGCAINIERDRDAGEVVTSLVRNEAVLAMMRERALKLGKPDAAIQTARAILARLASAGEGGS